jgi:anthranilate synthase component 1
MKNYKLYTSHKKLLADTTTPVSIYLRLRDVFPNSILLESSDYHSRENSLSYVCCDPIAGIVLNEEQLETYFPDGQKEQYAVGDLNLKKHVSEFRKCFLSTSENDFKFISNGLFGYFAYETVEHFEDIKFQSAPAEGRGIPLMQYHVYRYIIVIDHFKNELYLLEHHTEENATDGLDKIQYLIQNKTSLSINSV